MPTRAAPKTTRTAPITPRTAPLAIRAQGVHRLSVLQFLSNPCLSTTLAAEDARAQAYYDSDDAYHFYKEVWGGHHIHVGLYNGVDGDIFSEDGAGDGDGDGDEGRIHAASQRSLERLFALRPPTEGSRVMDMGAAYGGTARFCATTYRPALVSCVELSAKENARYRHVTVL
jgi:sarcosine/dimethylglycine N-methyltransferase